MIRRHEAHVRLRDCERLHELALVEQLGDAEIEQLGHAVARNQDVRRLQVAMHNQVLMRGIDRRADGGEQLETFVDGELIAIAIDIDRLAVDVLHDDVRRAVSRRTAVQELGDIRMIERGEDLALDPQALLHLFRDEAAAHQLDGDLLAELAVCAFGQEHGAHAAFPERAQDAVRSDAFADEIGGRVGAGAAVARGVEVGPAGRIRGVVSDAAGGHRVAVRRANELVR
jgi:hypothetical protein